MKVIYMNKKKTDNSFLYKIKIIDIDLRIKTKNFIVKLNILFI